MSSTTKGLIKYYISSKTRDKTIYDHLPFIDNDCQISLVKLAWPPSFEVMAGCVSCYLVSVKTVV